MKKPIYVIKEVGDNFYINRTKIDSKIFDEELVDYRIEDRESIIDNLIMWISECTNSDKQLMKDDLKLLINIDDEFVLSSISTNDYLYGNSETFNTKCVEILEIARKV
jgi:hypothetical protein